MWYCLRNEGDRSLDSCRDKGILQGTCLSAGIQSIRGIPLSVEISVQRRGLTQRPHRRIDRPEAPRARPVLPRPQVDQPQVRVKFFARVQAGVGRAACRCNQVPPSVVRVRGRLRATAVRQESDISMGIVAVEFRRSDASSAGKWFAPGATFGAEAGRPGRAFGELVDAPAGRVRARARGERGGCRRRGRGLD